MDNAQKDAASRGGSKDNVLAYVLLFMTPAFFGVNQIMAPYAAPFFPPAAMAFWRWSIASLLLCFVVGPSLWRLRHQALAEWRDLLVLGTFGMLLCGAVVYLGGRTTTATNIGLIYAASPVLIILLSRFVYGEAMTLRQTAGVALALVGVISIIAKGSLEALMSVRFTIGDLYMCISSAAWAFYAVLLNHRPTKLDPQSRFLAISIAGSLVLAPFALWEGLAYQAPALDWRNTGIVLLLALVPGLLAYMSFGFVQRVLGPARTSISLYLGPIHTVILASIFLGETISDYHLMGFGLILPGIFLATVKKKA